MPTELPQAPETVALRDGTLLHIRPIRPDDAPRLQALHARLSPESIYMRFLGPHPVLSDQEAQPLATVDYHTRMAFVATRTESGGEAAAEAIIGVARYGLVQPDRPDEAEVAIVVEDQYQNRGVGTILIESLLAYARAQGIRTVVAEINVGNERMLRFIRRGRLPTERALEGGVWRIRVTLAEGPE